MHKDKRLEKASDKKSIREQNKKKYERPSFFFSRSFCGREGEEESRAICQTRRRVLSFRFYGVASTLSNCSHNERNFANMYSNNSIFRNDQINQTVCSILSRRAINIEASFEPIVGYACTIGLTSAHPFLISLASPPLKSKQTQLLGRRVRALLPHSPYRKCCDSKDRPPHIFAQGGRQS